MASNGETTSEGKPQNPPERPTGELGWIREALNNLAARFDKLDLRLDKLDAKVDKLEERLRKVENRMYWIGGIITALLVIVGALQILMRVADVSITLK